MRSVLARCLVALLVLALAGGNVHARVRLAIPAQPASHEHLHHHSGTSQDNKQQNRAVRCCCDGLGCLSAAYTVPVNPGAVTPTVFAMVVLYHREPGLLPGRNLLPEPKPPRLGSPS
jgi:hypothetical protein